MKAAHLEKISKRAERALDLILPFEVSRGEVGDPKDRLGEIIRRVDGKRNPELVNDIWALTELLETDVPAMIQAVRDAQAEVRQARRELSQRAGTTYRITITSDAPLGVFQEEAGS